jgi:hypothetical protein
VIVDPVCPSHIFAAHGYASTLGQAGAGIYFSNNTGTSWTPLTVGTPFFAAPIASMTLDPTLCGASCEFLWAATYGMGTWRYDADSTDCP